jgi:hypothetical protein
VNRYLCVAVLIGLALGFGACSSSSKASAGNPLLPSSCKGAVEHEYLFGGLDPARPEIEQAIRTQTLTQCKSSAEWLAAAKAQVASGTAPFTTGALRVTFQGGSTSPPRDGPTLQNMTPEKLLAMFCKSATSAPACK